MKNPKAFTLVEMLVVIVLIGVIISMTMFFSLDRLQQLQGQTAKEQFVSDIKFLRTHTLASSLYDWQAYQSATITIQDQDTGFTQTFVTLEDTIQEQKVLQNDWYIHTIYQQNPVEALSIIYTPYEIGCSIQVEESTIQQGVVALVTYFWTARYCFAIQPNTCTIQETDCDTIF